jgi:hypothetical protein
VCGACRACGLCLIVAMVRFGSRFYSSVKLERSRRQVRKVKVRCSLAAGNGVEGTAVCIFLKAYTAAHINGKGGRSTS